MKRVQVDFRKGGSAFTYICEDCAERHGIRVPRKALNVTVLAVGTAWANGRERVEPCLHPAHGQAGESLPACLPVEAEQTDLHADGECA